MKAVFIAIPLLVASVIGFSLYNRYLVEHVQIGHISKQIVRAYSAPRASATVATVHIKPVSDDWDYRDGNMSIKITKQHERFSAYTSVMFVADVQLSDMGFFDTAFANDKFGTNIVQKVSSMAKSSNAMLAINGDFYGFRDDGIIVRNGVLYRNKPVREMFAVFKDGTMAAYDEKTADLNKLMSSGLIDIFSFGPVLVTNGVPASRFPKMTSDIDIHFQDRNPRTGIGYISPRHFLFVVVDGRNPRYSTGLTLQEFAQEFTRLGCREAYNLDGGGSSTMYFKGRVVNHGTVKNGYSRNKTAIIQPA